MKNAVLICNARVIDPASGVVEDDQFVSVEGGRIAATGPMHDVNRRGNQSVSIIDVRGTCVLPGLIDCHVHLMQGSADMRYLEETSPTYATAVAVREMREMLARGFTTVRDTGGADYGLARAVQDGYIVGPDVRFGGRALSQTGGHGDTRRAGELDRCVDIGALADVVCDGVEEVRRAARVELARGADHIKIMASGGVGSPTDRVDSVQFSREEILAVVGEARAANRYVAAHAYPSAAIIHALECGVRSIEHGNLLNDEAAQLLVERDAFVVPTLAAYHWLQKEGRSSSAPETSLVKNANLLEEGLGALERASRVGAKIAYGTDLLGPMRRHQLSEFTIRREVQSPMQVIQSATSVAAELVGQVGELGTVSAGARADLIVVDGDPLEDIGVLTRPQKNLRLVMKSGSVVRNGLG